MILKNTTKTRVLVLISAALAPLCAFAADEAASALDSDPVRWLILAFGVYILIKDARKKAKNSSSAPSRSSAFSRKPRPQPQRRVRSPRRAEKKRPFVGIWDQHRKDIYRDWGIII